MSKPVPKGLSKEPIDKHPNRNEQLDRSYAHREGDPQMGKHLYDYDEWEANHKQTKKQSRFISSSSSSHDETDESDLYDA